jgi:hypothetical protein
MSSDHSAVVDEAAFAKRNSYFFFDSDAKLIKSDPVGIGKVQRRHLSFGSDTARWIGDGLRDRLFIPRSFDERAQSSNPS